MTQQQEGWKEELLLGGEIFDYEGDVRRDGAEKLNALIRREIARAREEGKMKGDAGGDFRGYQEGLENGKKIGRTATLKEVVALVEMQEYEPTPVEEDIAAGFTETEALALKNNSVGYLMACEDIKRSVTTLLEQETNK